ncbi:hypothetical protein B0H11DRAFT_1757775 [Mycena galericulata]|nr:hypothetical protein B0H11DRAFT_1757775 [Mycena galericulata]
MQSNWRLEYATALDSVLTSALGKGDGRYEVIEFEPRWVLKVTLQDNRLHWKQVPFSNEIKRAGYIALSYPVDSAVVLATENNFKWSPKPADRDYTLKDRRTIAEYLLKLYLTTDGREWNQDRVEYIWLDEWCLSDRSGWDTRPDKEEDKHRGPEIGRLADIFRGAAQTVIFCHEEDCDHTGLKCIWGHRLWTIAEILHAQTVLPMTRRREGTELKAYISRTSGSAFRAAMQAHAARGNRWHLYSIFQHTVNAGAVSWQVAIHALVVEAIRRDDKNSKYHEHKHLGRALNGLLPRRARTSDFGAGGWSDLAWLLELNQGFYNAASLAAVCGVADAGATVSWLGKPIHPAAGNERLEPVVTAFPQAVSGAADPLLTIIGCETLGLRPTPLKRDSYGLYNNEEMRPIKWLAIFPCALLVIGGAQFLSQGNFGMFFLLVYISTILYCIVEMIVSTMFLERCGWAYFEDTMYGDKLELKLGEQDHNLRNLTHWG